MLRHAGYFKSQEFIDEGGWELYPKALKELFDEAASSLPVTRPEPV